MKFLKYFMFTFAIVFISCYLVGLAAPSPAYDVQTPNYYYHPDLSDAVADFGYVPVSLPDSIIMCSVVDGTPAACWYMPQGAVILVPVPETAPVDSL